MWKSPVLGIEPFVRKSAIVCNVRGAVNGQSQSVTHRHRGIPYENGQSFTAPLADRIPIDPSPQCRGQVSVAVIGHSTGAARPASAYGPPTGRRPCSCQLLQLGHVLSFASATRICFLASSWSSFACLRRHVRHRKLICQPDACIHGLSCRDTRYTGMRITRLTLPSHCTSTRKALGGLIVWAVFSVTVTVSRKTSFVD